MDCCCIRILSIPILVRLLQYLSINSTIFPTYKTLKETVPYLNNTMFHPSTVPNANFKLELILKFYHVHYIDCVGWNITYRFQCTTKYMITSTRSYITFIWMRIINSIIDVCSFPLYTSAYSYESTYEDIFAPACL